MVRYSVTLNKDDERIGGYNIEKEMFEKLIIELTPYRTSKIKPKQIRCVETGEVFRCARSVEKWLHEQELTSSYSADATIKSACKGKRATAYGFHWEFVGEDT